MIDPKDITKMVKHIVRRDTGVPDSNIMHPMREWVMGLLVVGLSVIGGAGFAVVIYRTYNAELVSEVPVVTAVIPYKAGLVASAITYFEAERKTYESLLGMESFGGKSGGVGTTTIPVIPPALATTTPAIEEIKVEASSTVVVPVEPVKSIEPSGGGTPVPQM